MFQTISMRQLEEMLNRGGDFILLDVRDREEYGRGHLEGAVNLPLSEIEQAGEMFSGDQEIIVYCSHGSHSLLAVRELSRMGFRAVNTYGGLSYYRGRHFVSS